MCLGRVVTLIARKSMKCSKQEIILTARTKLSDQHKLEIQVLLGTLNRPINSEKSVAFLHGLFSDKIATSALKPQLTQKI